MFKRERSAQENSIVDVYFPDKGNTLSYFNDSFDLHKGDVVYVEGKMEGLKGCVQRLSYSFKIKLSDYKRVISVADTNVRGELYFAGSHFVSFDPEVIPYSKVLSWFKAPPDEYEVYVTGEDGGSFELEDLTGMGVGLSIGERGEQYYLEDRVVFLCLDGSRGRAIVKGTKAYELEFCYRSGEISGLVCDCPCTYTCKHAVAAMMQLRETLELIEKNYQDAFEHTGYFAAVTKAALFRHVINGKEEGSIRL